MEAYLNIQHLVDVTDLFLFWPSLGSLAGIRGPPDLTNSACPIRLRLAIWAQNLQVRS